MNQRDYLLAGSVDSGMPAPPEGGHIGGVLDTLYQSRKTIALVTALFTLVGGAYALLARPIYQADILIQVEENQNSAKSALSDLSSMFAVKTAASAEIEVLRSRMIVSRAVDATQLYLNVTPRYFPVVGQWIAHHLNVSNWSGWGGYAWGNEAIDVAHFDVPDRLHGARFVLTAKAGGAYILKHDGIETAGRVGQPLHLAVPGGEIDLLVNSIDAHPGVSFQLVRSSELA